MINIPEPVLVLVFGFIIPFSWIIFMLRNLAVCDDIDPSKATKKSTWMKRVFMRLPD